MVTWQKQGTEIKTRYTVEYITDKNDWQRVCDGDHDAPWELYQTRVYESMDDVLTFYLVRFFDENTFDVKLFEQIEVDGEQVREAYIEPAGHILDSVRAAVDLDMRNRMNKAEYRLEETQKWLDEKTNELNKCRSFISNYGAWGKFSNFKIKVSK
ncbi:hypothetical protein D5272_01650 [bacterium D16-76]|nr:hypothetical protein [bacterium D16-76]